MPWNLEQLRDLVRAAHGDLRAKQCWSSVQSIVQRQKFSSYHFAQYKRLIEGRFPSGRTLQQEWTEALRFGEEAWTNHTVETQAEAHVIACLQNMHCVSDTLGHVIYLALGPQLPRLERLGQRGSSIDGVRKALSSSNDFLRLSSAIDGLCSHDDYAHLRDVVNHSKHRRIVPLAILIEAPHGDFVEPLLRLPAFEHDGRTYGARDIESALEREYVRQSHLVVEIGSALNHEIRRP